MLPPRGSSLLWTCPSHCKAHSRDLRLTPQDRMTKQEGRQRRKLLRMGSGGGGASPTQGLGQWLRGMATSPSLGSVPASGVRGPCSLPGLGNTLSPQRGGPQGEERPPALSERGTAGGPGGCPVALIPRVLERPGHPASCLPRGGRDTGSAGPGPRVVASPTALPDGTVS